MSDSKSFTIKKTYVKDLSVEVPNGPEAFLSKSPPKIDFKVDRNNLKINQDDYIKNRTFSSRSSSTTSSSTNYSTMKTNIIKTRSSYICEILQEEKIHEEKMLAQNCLNYLTEFGYSFFIVDDRNNKLIPLTKNNNTVKLGKEGINCLATISSDKKIIKK